MTSRRPLTLAVALAVLVGVLGLAGLGAVRRDADRARGQVWPVATATPGYRTPAPDVRRARTAAAIGVLDRWDRRRSAAYQAGDAHRLRRLYTRDSRAALADVRLLRDYVRRGLRVTGMRNQLFRVEVVDEPGPTLVLRVRDRVAVARLVPSAGGDSRGITTRGPVTEERVSLRRERGRWLVVSVRST